MMKFLQTLCVFIGVSVLSQAPVNIKVKDNAGNESFQVTCTNDLDPNGCISLNVEYPALKQTTGYEVTQESYNPPFPLNQGTALNANYDDLFAAKLNLPFKFCFYNQYFEALVVGSNGMVTFDLSQLGNINYPNVQWQNPNTNLPKNSIFGAYHDMVFSANDSSEIYYSTVGTAPYRKFVISFSDGRVSGCTDRSSSQIVLHETTNIIDVFIEKKLTPCPTRKFENALVGIINSTGSQGVSPASRNTGVWQALQEGWRFSPNGNTIQPQVTWTNGAGQTVGTGIQTTVCPSQNDVYTANVVFNICGNSNLTLTDDFPVTFDPTYPAAKNYTQNFCGNTNLTLNSFQANLTTQNPANFTFSFHTSLQDAQNNANPLPNNYTLTANTVLYARIQNPAVPSCYRVAVLTLNLLNKSLLKNTVELCDTNNDGTEANYDLSLLNAELFVPGTTGIAYYASQSDAQNNTNAITTATITAGTQLWIRLQEGTCVYILGPVSFQFRPGVNLNSPVNFTYSICDINADNQESFDYALTVGPLITTQPGAVFTAYNTYNEAFAGSGAVINVIKEGIYTVYVRVQIPNGCFAVATVNMNVTFTKITANEKTEYLCFNGTEDISINLNTLSAGMLISPATVPATEFYANYNDATSGNNPISANQIITADGNFVTQVYFVKFRIAEDCYTIRAITVNLVHPVAVQSAFTVCDTGNNNSENVLLSQFAPAVIGTQNAGVIFYPTAADAAAGTNPLTSITLTGTQQLFVKINSYNCQQVYPVTLSLTSTPVVNSPVNIVLNNICDNNNDGAEIYDLTQTQPQVSAGNNVSFTYYLNYNAAANVFSNPVADPTQFTVSGGNATVFVKVKFNNNECFSAAQINIQMNFLPAVILNTTAVLNTCDEDFNLNETFQLTDALPQLFTAAQNTYPLSDLTITYYNTAAQANLGNPANQIGNSITTTVSTVQVWARFQSKTTGCYSVAPVQLNTYFPPKAINSTITVCDENLDGSYEVNLLNFTNLMVDIQNPANAFTFYLSQQDAQNGTNPIANPANFTANPFPAQIWVRVQNIPGCDDIASVSFVFGNKVTLQNAGPFQLAVCDIGSNGSETVNLTQFQTQIYSGANAVFTYYPSLADLNAGTNAIATPAGFLYSQNSASSTVYVKVSVPGFCSEVAEIQLSLKQVPVFDIPTLYFCPEGSLEYTVKIEGFTITAYVWTNPAGQVISTTDTITGITAPGNYTLTVTAVNGCSYTDTFEIKYYDVPVITSLDFSGNTATVQATGLQTIVYSIDGTNWQAGNVFYNLPTGITTFYVKYVNSACIVKQQGVVLDIKNAITPNGDGLNDHWIVKNLHVFGTRLSNVKIFDRYQMLIFEQSSNTQFYWDGTMKGRAIPTSSYWYVVTLPDGRTFTGWILVKNNN